MPNKNCPECQGTGFRPIEVDGVQRFTSCNCRDPERIQQLLASARIPRRYEHCTFESFNVLKDRQSGQANPSQTAALKFARRFVEDYHPATDYGLLFFGKTGRGKTHLAVAVLRELILQKGVECLFYDFRDLLKTIQDSYNAVSQTSEQRVLQPVLDVEVLLLDELTGANPSDWVKDTVAHIINSRYNQKRVTLITTTLAPRKTMASGVKGPDGNEIPTLERTLSQFGPTLLSRLYEMCKIIEIDTPGDFRETIKQAGYSFQVD